MDRYYLLATDLDRPRPWTRKTNIPVFSLALVREGQDMKRWLLFAHSPLEDRQGVRITIPDYGPVTVDVPRAGAFWVVEESAKQIEPIE